MQLTTHTDYALRVLIALALVRPEKKTVGQLSAAYNVSENHLTKVVQRLAALGYVETSRGKSGGAFLRTPASQINIGQVVREVENDLGLVPCLRRGGGTCSITPACKLKSVLREATERFLDALGNYTLADITQNDHQLARLLGVTLPTSAPLAAPVAPPSPPHTETRARRSARG